jgi:NAD(P)-dependent dehydrogenase (short-subunit alcohol dehydrogenase family)
MPTNQLIHRRVIVTGGLGALGRHVGVELSARGARVALVDRAAIAPVDGVEAVFGGVDLGDAASTTSAFSQVAERLGGIDSLVNIAGGFAWETLESGSIETWDRLYAMNVRTAAIASREALPYLLRGPYARIVNVGALAALKAGAGMGAYAASKAGVARLTEALAEELKDRNVTVNAVLPSILDTPANRADMPDADASRWVAPDKLAAVIAFLLSDDASAVTGACLPVAGRV